MKKRTTYAGWIARICSIIAIMFVSVFALDAFEHGSLIEKLGAFAIHMIPSIILVLVLLLSWKFELLGGIFFVLIGIGTAPFIYQLNFERTHSVNVCLQVLCMINLPFVIVGILFIYSYYKLKKIH